MIRSKMSGSTDQGVFTMLTQSLEVTTPRGATKIALPRRFQA